MQNGISGPMFSRVKPSKGNLWMFRFSVSSEVPVRRFRPDIKKFGKVLKVIKTLEPLFALISVTAMLRMFGFSKVCFWLSVTLLVVYERS